MLAREIFVEVVTQQYFQSTILEIIPSQVRSIKMKFYTSTVCMGNKQYNYSLHFDHD